MAEVTKKIDRATLERGRALSEIQGVKVPVLDHGFVRLVDVMGSDRDIVQAARQSFDEEARPTKDDRHLIRYMMRKRHTSPFEMAELKFQIKVPIFVMRQWVRHRVANLNEYSMRYSPAIEEMYQPQTWRAQDQNNKQGSQGVILEPEALSWDQATEQSRAMHAYQDRIAKGVAREQARIDLPVSIYTVATWKIDLHNLLHFLSLRCDKHAQWEIRQFADVMAGMVERLFPLTWEAYCDYRRDALTLSRMEIEALKGMILADQTTRDALVGSSGLLGRERAEFGEKLNLLFGRST